MAIDPEEMKRRRLLRQQQREQKQQQSRKLFLRLGVAGAILLVCGILILTIRPASEKTSPQESTASTQESSTGETAVMEQQPTTVIHLAAAGDLNITDGVVASGGAGYDYTKVFQDVAPLLADADISLLNLEGNLYGEPYGTQSRSAPQKLMEALANAGLDCVQLANSYSINQGVSGLGQTIDGVENAGLVPLGVYRTNQEFREKNGYTICRVKGVDIAFVAFTKGMDGMALPAGSENCVNVLYEDYDSTYQTINVQKITQILRAVEKEKPDLIVALLHWGSEFNDTISASQKRIVGLLQELGTDAIIGTHSHYVQKMSLNEQTGQFVAYSLGDFYGDAQRSGSEYGAVLDLEITKDNKSGETAITGYSYTPIFTATGETGPVGVLRINEAITAYENNYIERVSEQNYTAMQYALERIAARVAGE